MLLGLVITFSLAAADADVAVLVGRRTSMSAAEAQRVSQTISTHLTSARVPLKLDADAARANLSRLGLKDASACNGRKACITELGRQLQVGWVISLSLSQVGNDRSIALELLRVSDGVVSEKDAIILPTDASVTADQLSAFAARVRTQLGLVDAPVAEVTPPPVVTPPAVEPPPLATVPVVTAPVAPPPKSHVTSLVLGGVAVAALAVATGLLVSGLNGRAEAYATTEVDGTLRSPYAASEVQRRAGVANVELGIAGGAAAVGLGLGVGAVIAW